MTLDSTGMVDTFNSMGIYPEGETKPKQLITRQPSNTATSRTI